jgi:hypothetical protein
LAVELAGDASFEAAPGFAFGFAFGEAFGGVGLGFEVVGLAGASAGDRSDTFQVQQSRGGGVHQSLEADLIGGQFLAQGGDVFGAADHHT